MSAADVRPDLPAAKPIRKAGSTARDGGLMGLVLSLVLQPFEVVRTQLVLHGDKKLGTIRQMNAVCSKLYREQGIQFFWKGSMM